MKKSVLAFVLILQWNWSSWAVSTKGSEMQSNVIQSSEITMRIGSKSFDVTLIDNETTRRLKEMFPLKIQMKDLHGNEKFYDLPKALPTASSNPKMIKAGDILLYGSNTLVVFYKSFATTYSYTRLGQVSEPLNLEAALGSGDVTVTLGGE